MKTKSLTNISTKVSKTAGRIGFVLKEKSPEILLADGIAMCLNKVRENFHDFDENSHVTGDTCRGTK